MTTPPEASLSLTLCASELQARLLRAQYQRMQSGTGHTAWESPAILSLGRWVRQQWLQSWPTQELISRSKERWLWQELIRADACHSQLLAPDALAEQFMRVWRDCHQWQLDPLGEPRWTREQELYARLHVTFVEELQRRQWITDSQLAGVILREIEQHPHSKPADVQALGFHAASTNRIEQALLLALDADGLFRTNPQVPQTPAYRYETPGAMWAGLAQQVAQTLDKDPDARIIVAVPTLSQQSANIDVHWTPRLAPALLDPQLATEAVRPWALEQPQPLGNYPVVGALLDLCSLAPHGMDFSGLSTVLRQAFFFSPEERLFTARAEHRLRDMGLRYTATDLSEFLPGDASPELVNRLRRLTDVISHEPRTANGADWAAHWQLRWQALPLTDPNPHWGIREDLQQALTGFVSLADEMGVLTRNGALATFKQVLQDHMHSARVAHDVRVLVCDSSQAIGLPCSHLFVANVDTKNYPAPRPPNPWLNPELLLAIDHPQASPHHWLRQQRERLEALCQQPDTSGLFYAAQDESGTPLNPTPLLKCDWQPGPTPTDLAAHAPQLQWLEHDNVPPLTPTRLAKQNGGSSLVRRQSASPFAAFVYHRIGARELAPIPSGLSPARQGEWVHAVLAAFWEEHRNSSTLAAFGDNDVSAKLQQLIEQTRGRYLPPVRYGKELQALEADRVLRLCSRWLQHERKRTDPFEVLHCEMPFATTRSGLPLRLRLDRLDRVKTAYGDRHLVIDYKTGQADMNGWRGEVLREPQLPLYATSPVLQDLNIPAIDGICFARVHEYQPALLAATSWCKKLTADSPSDKEWKYIWEDELAQWEHQLESLIHSFRDGEIRHRLQTDLSRDFGLRSAAFLVDEQEQDTEEPDA